MGTWLKLVVQVLLVCSQLSGGNTSKCHEVEDSVSNDTDLILEAVSQFPPEVDLASEGHKVFFRDGSLSKPEFVSLDGSQFGHKGDGDVELYFEDKKVAIFRAKRTLHRYIVLIRSSVDKREYTAHPAYVYLYGNASRVLEWDAVVEDSREDESNDFFSAFLENSLNQNEEDDRLNTLHPSEGHMKRVRRTVYRSPRYFPKPSGRSFKQVKPMEMDVELDDPEYEGCNIPQCSGPAFHPYGGSCRRYIECVKTKTSLWFGYVYKCPAGLKWNEFTNKCQVGELPLKSRCLDRDWVDDECETAGRGTPAPPPPPKPKPPPPPPRPKPPPPPPPKPKPKPPPPKPKPTPPPPPKPKPPPSPPVKPKPPPSPPVKPKPPPPPPPKPKPKPPPPVKPKPPPPPPPKPKPKPPPPVKPKPPPPPKPKPPPPPQPPPRPPPPPVECDPEDGDSGSCEPEVDSREGGEDSGKDVPDNFVCDGNHLGRYPLPRFCNIYRDCHKGLVPGTFAQTYEQCVSNMWFSEKTQACEYLPVDEDAKCRTTAWNPPRYFSNSRFPSPENAAQCEDKGIEGKFPDYKRCNRYIVCQTFKGNKDRYWLHDGNLKCPAGTYFHPDTFECTKGALPRNCFGYRPRVRPWYVNPKPRAGRSFKGRRGRRAVEHKSKWRSSLSKNGIDGLYSVLGVPPKSKSSKAKLKHHRHQSHLQVSRQNRRGVHCRDEQPSMKGLLEQQQHTNGRVPSAELLDFYLQALRVQCDKGIRLNTFRLIENGFLTRKSTTEVGLFINATNPLFSKKLPLTTSEWSDLISSIYLSAFSEAAQEIASLLQSGDGSLSTSLVSSEMSTLESVALKVFEMKEQFPQHDAKISRSLSRVLETWIYKMETEERVLAKECRDCSTEKKQVHRALEHLRSIHRLVEPC